MMKHVSALHAELEGWLSRCKVKLRLYVDSIFDPFGDTFVANLSARYIFSSRLLNIQSKDSFFSLRVNGVIESKMRSTTTQNAWETLPSRTGIMRIGPTLQWKRDPTNRISSTLRDRITGQRHSVLQEYSGQSPYVHLVQRNRLTSPRFIESSADLSFVTRINGNRYGEHSWRPR